MRLTALLINEFQHKSHWKHREGLQDKKIMFDKESNGITSLTTLQAWRVSARVDEKQDYGWPEGHDNTAKCPFVALPNLNKKLEKND